MTARPEPDVEVPTGDAKKGAKLYKAKCFQCHTIEQGGLTKQGPPLFDIFGKQSGTSEGFSYSDANKSSGITWSEKHMFEYLINPKKYIPGTKMVLAEIGRKGHSTAWSQVTEIMHRKEMVFAGIKKTAERADLIAYMANMS
jgi:cytochrome c